MMPPSDERQRFRRQCLATLSGAGAVLLVCAVWALWPTPPISVPAASALNQTMPAVASGNASITPDLWRVTLWRPFKDAPPVVPPPPPPPPPLTMKLFSILKRGGGYTAAIDPGDGSPLVYAKSGDRIKGVEIIAIDERGVTVANGDQRQRLEMQR